MGEDSESDPLPQSFDVHAQIIRSLLCGQVSIDLRCRRLDRFEEFQDRLDDDLEW